MFKNLTNMFLNDLKAATIKNVEDAKNSKDNKYMGDVAEVLLQSIQIIQSKLAGLSYSDTKSININNILLNNKTDVDNNGELYKKYLMWNNNKKQLQEQKATLEGLLKNLDVFNENPDWIINWANHANYNNKIKISDYWPQNYSVNDSESSIAPAYQYETSMKIIEVLSSLARESEFNQNNNNYISYFISDYAIKRDDAWEKFTSDFSPNKMTIPTKASWLSILRNNNVGSTYIDYAKAIKINFDNDDFKNTKPEWVDLTIKLEPYFENSLIISNTSGFKKSWWQVINSYINSYYISSDNNLWSYDSNILTSINKYQDDLAKTRNLVDTANDETSFKTMESLMYKDNGSDISKSLKQTSKDYQAIILQAESVWPELSVNSNSMVWNLYRNGLNVLIYGISQNTMCYINNDWSKTILNENSTIIENNNIYEWFDSDSIISKFMTKNVKPFITYDNSTNSFVSKIIDGQSLQFSDFTYNYLNSELYYKKLKSIESQISKKLKENGQNITIGTGPTSLNKDAKILPYSTTFNFICDGKAQSFTNYNTGYNFIISNDIFSCTEASININFNGTNEFTVSKKYYGNDSVLQMMNAFAKDKNVIFKIQDLSGDVNVLQNYDINSIDIDINFGDLGLYDLLTAYSSYRSKMMTNIGDLQSIKIANCWDNQ